MMRRSTLPVLMALLTVDWCAAGDAPERRDVVLLASPGRILTAKPAPRTKAATAESVKERDDGRIYGGQPVSKNFAHWQAEIYRQFAPADWAYHVATTRDTRPEWQLAHHCGGALIGDGWILTAAHCVVVTDPTRQASMMRAGFASRRGSIAVSKMRQVSLSDCIKADMVDPEFRIRLGVTDISRANGVSYRIDCAVPHIEFNPADFYHNDIALLHFTADDATGALDPSTVQQIRLHTRAAPDNGTALTVTGWGKSRPVGGHAPTALLLRTDLQIMEQRQCVQTLRVTPDKLHDSVLCAGAATSKTCLGDSGGPVVLSGGRPYYLVGLVSWGATDCKGDAAPGVYTRIGAYAAWIADVLQAAR